LPIATDWNERTNWENRSFRHFLWIGGNVDTAFNIMEDPNPVEQPGLEVEVEEGNTPTPTDAAPAKVLDSSDGSEGSEDNLKKDLNSNNHPGDAADGPSDPADLVFKTLPLREFRFKLGAEYVSFNPLTSFLGVAVLWGLSIWCMTNPVTALDSLDKAKTQVTRYFTWFFIFSRPVFVFFIIYVAYRYGNIKLGPKDAKPAYSDISYFAMLFSAGVAVGLFFFGVSEPLWYQTDNWFANAGYHTQDEIDQNAVSLSTKPIFFCIHSQFES
jgi:hypothetical protein